MQLKPRGQVMTPRWRVVLTGVMLAAAAASASEFKVIVNTANPKTSITAEELSELFLRKTLTWPNGKAVVPTDLSPDSPVRASFSMAVHERDVPAIKSYWQRQIFSGRAVPPVEHTSEEDLVSFVASTPGAVGYVAPSTELTSRVKVLEVED
jgi:ABC-type phosphate transport system substrate-binding protein